MKLVAGDLAKPAARVLELAGEKRAGWTGNGTPRGAPVFTVNGKYTTRGWTEWTQGFQYGVAILAFDGTDQRDLLEIGRSKTLQFMAPHVSNVGVHDHGFNNLSTYGNLRRLMREKRVELDEWEMSFYELAIKASGAVQAARWMPLDDGGYIYSFNGPHSLFIDTMRSLRILGLAHQLGHVLMGENDAKISLLDRLITHGKTTAKYNIYYGAGAMCMTRRRLADGRRRRRSSTTGGFVVRIRSRDIRRSARGHGVWRGRFWDSQRNWNSCARSKQRSGRMT